MITQEIRTVEKAPTRLTPQIVLIRSLHGVISVFFLACLACLYYAGISGHVTAWTYAAGAALILEGLVVLLNHGDCPLGSIHHRLGDDKAFFELFLPPRIAKQGIPFLTVVALVGMFLVLV